MRGEYEFSAFAYLVNVARGLSDAALRAEGNAGACRIASVVFWVFAFEALLNHIGKRRFDDWNKQEKELSPKDKIKKISEAIKPDMVIGKAPLQTVWNAYALRNYVAHGKTVARDVEFLATGNLDHDDNAMLLEVTGKYEQPEMSKLMRDHTEKVIRHFMEKAGLQEHEMQLILVGAFQQFAPNEP